MPKLNASDHRWLMELVDQDSRDDRYDHLLDEAGELDVDEVQAADLAYHGCIED